MLTAWAWATGAIHYDGLADTFDALGVAGREERLRVMRDGAVGVFAVLSVVLAVAAELAALGALRGAARTGALLAAPVLGRWAMVASGAGAPSARPDGLGAAFVREVGRRDLAVATVLSLVVVVPAAGTRGGRGLARRRPVGRGASAVRHVCVRRRHRRRARRRGAPRRDVDPRGVGKPMSKLRSRPLVLVTGGARSGKSRFALERAGGLGPPRVFIATAEAGDEEMAARIARHRADRPRGWRTVEAPRRLAPALRRLASGVVLVDCLTLWLANLMDDDPGFDPVPSVDELLRALRARRAAVVVVTNEVGFGIVPESPLGRAFRDAAGFMNQRVVEAADEAHLVVAGRALRIK